MQISELKTGQGKVNIKATIKSIEEPRVFEKFGKQIKVANAVIADDSGEMKLTLWNNDIEKVSVGSIVKITDGYVNEFKGEKQLTTGKFGKIEVVTGDSKEESEDVSEESEYDY